MKWFDQLMKKWVKGWDKDNMLVLIKEEEEDGGGEKKEIYMNILFFFLYFFYDVGEDRIKFYVL